MLVLKLSGIQMYSIMKTVRKILYNYKGFGIQLVGSKVGK